MTTIKSILVYRTVSSSGGGGNGVWGQITGTLSNQTDLQAALDLKENLRLAFNTPDLSASSGYVFVQSDGDTKEVRLSKATAIIATVPSLIAGTKILVKRTGAGSVNFLADPGVTITPSAGVLTDPGQNALMALVWVTATAVDLENGTPSSAGSGDVTGPASSVDSEIVLFNGTTGKTIKTSSKVLSTVGGNIAALSNPSAVRYIRINADNTVTAMTAQQQALAVGAGYYLKSSCVASSVTGTAAETLISSESVLVPGGTLQANDQLEFWAMLTKVGTAGNMILRINVNTSNSLTSDTQLVMMQAGATNLFAGTTRSMSIETQTVQSIFNTTTSLNNDAQSSTSAYTSLAVDFTVDQYFTLSITNGSSADTTTLRGWYIRLIRQAP